MKQKERTSVKISPDPLKHPSSRTTSHATTSLVVTETRAANPNSETTTEDATITLKDR